MATQVIEEFAMSELHSTSNKDDTKSSSSKAASNTKPQANALDTVSNANQESAEPQSPTSREDNYVHGFRLIILTISLMLAVFIIALDTTIIATAVPKITSSFHSISDIGWYSSAYLLPLMALQPTFGKIYTFFDIKTVFLIGLVTFEAGSVICATSSGSTMFIIGRVVSGVGGAMVYAGGQTIIGYAVPLGRVSIFMSTLSSMYGAAGLTGPPLGGLFTDNTGLTWRFCFWINLPFGALAIACFMFGFRAPIREPSELTVKEKLKQMDFGGTVLFVGSICCLFLALQSGGNVYAWSNVKVWGLLLGSALLMIAFLILQSYLGESATIPLRIFKNRSLISSVLVAIFMSGGVNTHTFYLPFYFQEAKGTTTVRSGILMLPYLLSVTATELAVGFAVAFVGYFAPFISTGTALFTAAAGVLCTLTVHSTTVRVIGYQILAATGFGSSLCLCATSVRASVNDKDLPIANSLTIFGPFFGGALAASISQNIFRSELRRKLISSVGMNETAMVISTGSSATTRLVPDSIKPEVFEAFSVAVNKTFVLAAVLGGLAFVSSLGIKWRSIKAKQD